MAALTYLYRLVRGEELVATGRLTVEEPLEVGANVEVAGYGGVVRAIDPSVGSRELQVAIEVIQTP